MAQELGKEVFVFKTLISYKEKMNEKLITALLAILLALGGWTLSRTFSLSTDMVLIKEKVSSLEEKIDGKFKKKKKKKKK
jgi:hypothetical protein